MRSVVVVLPASMWAMMPMLRTLSRGYSRAVISCANSLYLPAIVGKSLVGLGHLGHVLATLYRRTHAVAGVNNLIGQTVGHRLFATLFREVGNPLFPRGRQRRGAA